MNFNFRSVITLFVFAFYFDVTSMNTFRSLHHSIMSGVNIIFPLSSQLYHIRKFINRVTIVKNHLKSAHYWSKHIFNAFCHKRMKCNLLMTIQNGFISLKEHLHSILWRYYSYPNIFVSFYASVLMCEVKQVFAKKTDND